VNVRVLYLMCVCVCVCMYVYVYLYVYEIGCNFVMELFFLRILLMGVGQKKNHNRHKNIVRQFVGDCAFGS